MDVTRKAVAEAITITWDFTRELGTGETLSSVSGISQAESGAVSTGLTVGSPTLSTPRVTALVSVGVRGKMYVLSCAAVTSLGQTRVVEMAVSVY